MGMWKCNNTAFT